MPLRAISIGIVINRSISSGLAPGFCVITSTNGGVGSGYASTLRWYAEYRPMAISITVPRSTISRLCKLQVMIARTMRLHSIPETKCEMAGKSWD